MSFELQVQCFDNGEPAGISRETIRRTFGGHLSEPEENFWRLAFGPADSCALQLYPLEHAADEIHNITVERPCPDARLWQGLAELLAHGHTVLYFPGCPGPLLLDPGAASHMPADMLEALGEPTAVASGADILRCVRDA